MDKYSYRFIANVTTLSSCFLASCTFFGGVHEEKDIHFEKPPNIVMIAIDDMNDWIGAWGGQAITPNIDRLAAEGRAFINSYCIVPACNPSRANLLTGQRPETTGQYINDGNFRDLPGGVNRVTLPQYFRNLGYYAAAAGKIFHSPRGTGPEPNERSDDISWDYQWRGNMGTPGHNLYLNENGYAKWLDGAEQKYIKGTYHNTGMHYISRFGVWGPIPHSKEECGDWQIADFGAQFVQEDHDKPFFLALGIFRPHSPQLAPQEYFDMYPLNQIEMPYIPEDEMDDIPEIAKTNWSTPFVNLVKEKGEWENAVQGYLASMSFADDCVGHFLKALDQSKYKDNTIVIFWTDHGFQLAHKDRWEKFSLWRQGTRSPMIIRLPEGKMEPGNTNTPVSFLDIYPTLVDLAGMPIPEYLEGNSLMPILKDPDASWNYPAVVTFEPGNHSVLFENWNYIRYKDGAEELYDHNTDPGEFTNLALDPAFRSLMNRLAAWIPEAPINHL
jgi:arylsulfatase A-like enzyme